VIPAAFDYTRPASLDEALKLLSSGGGSKVIAGGQSLLPLLKLRLASADRLVDIGRLGELKGVTSLPDGRLAVGALTTYAELLESPARHYGLLRDALPTIGDVQVRNRGTVGGAIAHVHGAGAPPGEVHVNFTGEAGQSFGAFLTEGIDFRLAEDELVTEVRLPGPRDDAGSAYASLEQPASGYAIVGVAAVVIRSAANAPIGMSAIAITGVGPVAYRASAVEKALSGSDGSAGAIAAAAGHATDGVTVNSDIHADREYRTEMARVFTVRAIEAALARLG